MKVLRRGQLHRRDCDPDPSAERARPGPAIPPCRAASESCPWPSRPLSSEAALGTGRRPGAAGPLRYADAARPATPDQSPDQVTPIGMAGHRDTARPESSRREINETETVRPRGWVSISPKKIRLNAPAGCIAWLGESCAPTTASEHRRRGPSVHLPKSVAAGAPQHEDRMS